ncbi:unnamed protein product [Bemisia tabaci]|uniref:Lecithin:cholesterol acyltransferase n=2 Tax=Bemisia tabaci TaxID=7038 RepID=A0A9P0A0C7_BEMTA|nr:unnamed protein product [Bemisia tabaci]
MFISIFQWLLLLSFTCVPTWSYLSYDYNADVMAPVILVPGVVGTQVEGKWNTTTHPLYCEGSQGYWKLLWFKWDILAGGDSLRCWVYRYKLIYNRATHRSHNQIGVETRVPGRFGDLQPVEYMTRDLITQFGSGYLQDISNSLRASGYDSERNLKAAGYDGRYAPPQQVEIGYYAQFTKLVERVAADTKRKVAIITHSMGGIMAAYCLMNKSQAWKDRHIHAFIAIAAPWLGSAKPVEVFITGADFNIPTLDKSEMRELLRTFQSMALLLPSEEAYGDTVLVEWLNKNKNYTAKDYNQLFHDIHYTDGYLMRQDARSYMPIQGNKLGVKVVCIWSHGLQTPFKMIIKGNNITNPTSVNFTNVDGDGTVPLKSLRYCEKFPRVTSYEVSGYEHSQIMHSQRCLTILNPS